MNICGVELMGNDAVISFLSLDKGQFNIPDCRVRKLSLPKEHAREDLQQFQKAFAQLLMDYSTNSVAIKGRMARGKFAGGAIGFKLESAIQLIADIDVVVLSSVQIKSALANTPIPIPFSDTGLKGMQETAFNVAYAAHILA